MKALTRIFVKDRLGIHFGGATMKLSALLLVALAGCSTTLTPDAEMVPARTVLDPVVTAQRADRGLLLVKRDKGGHPGGALCDHEVSLDGKVVAKLKPGEFVAMYATPGEHIIGFRALATCPGANAVTAMAEVGKRKTFRTFANDQGALLMPSTE